MFIADVVDVLSRMRNSPRVHQADYTVFTPRTPRIIGLALRAREAEWPEVAGYVDAMLPALKSAHVFAFENMAVRNSLTGVEASVFPGLDEPGIGVFNAGRAALPFPSCWFEFELRPGVVQGLLVEDNETHVVVREFVRADRATGVEIHFCCYASLIMRSSFMSDEDYARMPPSRHARPVRLCMFPDDPMGHFVRYREWQRLESASENLSEQELTDRMAAEAKSALYLLLCLASNRKSVVTERAKPFANRRRRDKGLFPFPDRHVVTLPSDWAPGSLPPDLEELHRDI